MLYIICNTPKGQYLLELRKVAEHRANYYAENDGFKKGSKEWQDEVDFVMGDSYEGIDWLLNNTNWEDWKDDVLKINDDIKVLEEDFFTSSDDFEIEDYENHELLKA